MAALIRIASSFPIAKAKKRTTSTMSWWWFTKSPWRRPSPTSREAARSLRRLKSLHNHPPPPGCATWTRHAATMRPTAGTGSFRTLHLNFQCCQVLTSIHDHIRQNPGHFRSFHGHLSKICCCMIFQSTTIKKQKNKMFGKGFFIFFISALHLSIKNYTNFLCLTKFVSQHLIATHGHFHRHNLSPQIIFLYGLFWVI